MCGETKTQLDADIAYLKKRKPNATEQQIADFCDAVENYVDLGKDDRVAREYAFRDLTT